MLCGRVWVEWGNKGHGRAWTEDLGAGDGAEGWGVMVRVTARKKRDWFARACLRIGMRRGPRWLALGRPSCRQGESDGLI